MHVQTRAAGLRRHVLAILLAGALLGLVALTHSGDAGAATPAAREEGSAACGVPFCFASIAVDPSDGTYGFSFNDRTKIGAQQRSLRECRIRSDTRLCRNIVWMRNGCAAVAAVRRATGALTPIAWGFAPTRTRARVIAIGRCDRPACRVLTSVCTAR